MDLLNSLLGKKTEYKNIYENTLLFPIPRAKQRQELGINENNIPFFGVDIWNAYEVSWLNSKGKPNVAIGEFYIPAHSEYIIESKSFKLYLNSLNNTKFESADHVNKLLTQDLSNAVRAEVKVVLLPLNRHCEFEMFNGNNIDDLDIECINYDSADRSLIQFNDTYVEEDINSNLLKSNCLVTGQPDWGSVNIKYKGKKIVHKSLLEYLISFRNHNEFHEHCVERIFMDILDVIAPKYLSVYARYTRRGGLDISPYRSTDPNFEKPSNKRLIRQ